MYKIIGSGLIEKGGKYLLINAKSGASKGLWNNPGGHQESEETITDTVKREVKEETGFDVEVGRLIGTYIFENVKKHVFEARIVSGKLVCQPEEIEDAKWFSIDEAKRLPNITFGALQSIIDYSFKKSNQAYTANKVP